MSASRKVRDLFEAELARRGVAFEAAEDGTYVLTRDGGTNTVSLENVARQFDQDRDESRIARFVDTILNTADLLPKSWEEARPRIRWAVESMDVDLGDALADQFSDQARVGPVYVSPDETQVAFLPPAVAARWGQTRGSLMQAAAENMSALLAPLEVHVEEIDGHRLGMFSTPDDFTASAFKAAFLLCPGLKEVVEPVLGWPVFAVMPSRDFVYLVPQEDADLLPRLGPAVVREYHKSGYPVSKEVFEITDDGIRAVSEFQARDGGDPLDAADDMKTIRYRGGVVSFRVPSHWEEEYGEDGGGSFYDEDGVGVLELNVITFRSEEPVSDETLGEMMGGRADEVGGELVTLDSGDVCLHYEHHAGEGDDEQTIWRWEIANLVPPHHARVAAFSYVVEADLADDPEVEATLQMLREELSRCEFADQLGE